jgi:tetratricopeptide (TPR) repeat protein
MIPERCIYKMNILFKFYLVMIYFFILILSFCSLPDYRYNFSESSVTEELTDRKTLLIYPFKNTGTPKFSHFSDGITESLINDLYMVKGIGVISQEDRKKALKELAYKQTLGLEESDINKIATLTGADLFLTGSFSVEDKKIRMIARLIDAKTGSIIKSIKVDGLVEDIFSLQDSLALQLVTSSAKISKEEINFLKDKNTYSESTFDFFAKGLEIEDSNPKMALDFYKKSLNIQPEYLAALDKASFVSIILDQPSESLKYFNLAQKAREKKGMNQTSSNYKSFERYGDIYYNKENYDKALEFYNLAKITKEKIGFQRTSDYCNTISNIGNVYFSKGNTQKALDHFNKAQSLRKILKLENTPAFAITLNNIGNIYKSKGDFKNSLEYYKNAQEKREKLGLQNSSGYASILGNMGMVYNSLGNREKALDYYTKAQSIREKLGLQNTIGYASTLGNIGNLYNAEKKFDLALTFYGKSQTIRETLKNQISPGYATNLNNMGSIYSSLGNFKKAKEFYLQAQAIREKLSLQTTLEYSTTLANIGNVYEYEGDYKKAETYYIKAKIIKDELENKKIETKTIDTSDS